MERELKARSARTGQERLARRPCDCEAKISVGESGRRSERSGSASAQPDGSAQSLTLLATR